MPRTDTPAVRDLEVLLPSGQGHLRAANPSPKTITACIGGGEQLRAFLQARGMPTDETAIRREQVEASSRTLEESTGCSSVAVVGDD